MNAFDRASASGPWRALPVPTFLADRRAALRFQLAWAGGLAALLVVAAALAGGGTRVHLFQARSLASIWTQGMPGLLLGLGMAAAVARGGLDLSGGMIAALAGVVAARTGSPGLALLAALGCGLANGLLVALLRVPGWLVTASTVSILHVLALAQLEGHPFLPVDEAVVAPFLGGAGLAAGAGAVVALIWLQVLPGHGRRTSRLRRDVGDAVPYLYSAALAGVAGLFLDARLGVADVPRMPAAQWSELALIVALGGGFLGGGRANVVGTVVAAFGVAALRFGLQGAGVGAWLHEGIRTCLLVLAVIAGLGLHAAFARRHARRRPDGPPAEGVDAPAPRPGVRLFERELFHGPGRILAVPAHLVERRRALPLELGWSAALLVLLAAVAAASSRAMPALATATGLAGQARFAFVPLALALGASAVVARGGWDLSAPVLASLVPFLVARDGGVAAALALAVGVGLGNGVLVSVARLPGWAATALTALMLSGTRLGVLLHDGDRFVPAPAGLAFGPGVGWAVLAAAVAGGIAWLQLAPGGDPGRPLVRWRERLADGLPYLFSAALAFVAGLYLLQLLRGASAADPGAGAGASTIAAVILAGCWLGSGRANVVGVVLSVVTLGAVQALLLAQHRPPWVHEAAVGGLALVALAASRAVHLVAGRVHAARLAAAVPTPPPFPGMPG